MYATITHNATVICSMFLMAGIKTEKCQLKLIFHNFVDKCHLFGRNYCIIVR